MAQIGHVQLAARRYAFSIQSLHISKGHSTMAPYTAQSGENELTLGRPLLASGVIAGLLYIGSMGLFIAFIAPHLPPLDAPATQQAAFYAEQARNPLYSLIRYMIMAQLAPLALFFGALFSTLRRAEGHDAPLSVAVLVAGIMTSLISPLVEMIEGHLLLGLAASAGDPVVTRTFDGMTPVSFALSGFPQAVVLAGTALLVIRQHIAPRWIAWFGLLLAVISLLGTGTLLSASWFFVGTLSSILFKVWIIALSVALLRIPKVARQNALQHTTA